MSRGAESSKKSKISSPEKNFSKNFPKLFFEENPVFIFQLKEVFVGGGELDERIC
jgi:hypothetical protein